ncbi:MAG: glycine cleavage system aminomethyltransferase GcvT, partial [Pseudomonadota bacterium]
AFTRKRLDMGKKTALFESHQACNAKIVDFGGWDMPLHYGSQIEEHHQVRKEAGVFDVSHMTVVDVTGDDSRAFLGNLLANDVGKLTEPGKALYSCMLNHNGGVIDDLIVYYFAPDDYRLVVNASTREKDLAWISAQAQQTQVVLKERSDLAMLAVQGPQAIPRVKRLLDDSLGGELDNLKVFFATRTSEDWLVARTGYTGEDGVEVCLPEKDVAPFWDKLLAAGVTPAGLGARDTLRLEAGMNLYGNDMDEDTSPLESGLAWTVALKDSDGAPRSFIGAQSLRDQLTQGVACYLTGVLLEQRGVLRGGQEIFQNDELVGQVTSGSFSPTLEKSIGFARLRIDVATDCEVQIRNKRLPIRLTKLPFVRRGKIMV